MKREEQSACIHLVHRESIGFIINYSKSKGDGDGDGDADGGIIGELLYNYQKNRQSRESIRG